MSTLIKVGVMRGGPSNEYEISLATGGNVLKALREKLAEKYKAHDVLIDKKGLWHLDGLPIKPEDLRSRVDVVFNALHGAYGEDGTVQRFFELHSIPFTGSGSLGSAVGMNKVLSRKAFKQNGLKVAVGQEIRAKEIEEDPEAVARRLFVSFPMPAIVKPTSAGSSVGVSLVKTQKELIAGLKEAIKHGDSVLIEEFIKGLETSVGIIEGFRGQEQYVLPVVEIKPATTFFDYEAKYQGKSEEIVPARSISQHVKEELSKLAQSAHKALHLRHYSRSDFIVSPRRGIYILETNTLPGLTNESLVPKALRSVGSDTYELVDHLIQLALNA
jgi:D-alanine-D-alanine ligase